MPEPNPVDITAVRSDEEIKNDEYQKLNSIRGGLAFFVFYCFVGTLGFVKELLTVRTLAEILSGILIIASLLTPPIGIMRRLRYAPIVAKTFLILIIIIAIIAIFSNYKENAIMFISLLINAIWLIYFFVSKRVKVVFYPEKLGLLSANKN